jgi:CRP/FNR family transcriptional regulator, cyclic AMP receptor protein
MTAPDGFRLRWYSYSRRSLSVPIWGLGAKRLYGSVEASGSWAKQGPKQGLMTADSNDLEGARKLLANCILFRGLKTEERDAIASRARIRSFKPGETVFTIGSPGENMMAVLKGAIRISVPSPDGKEFLLAILPQGEVFGELSVLDGKPRSADAVADGTCTLALLDRRDVLSFFERNPAAWPKLLEVLSDRLRRTDELLAEIAMNQLPVRLAKAMLRVTGETPMAKSETNITLSQRELANMVGGTRESVNKCIRVWQRDGIVQVTGGMIVIKKRPALEAIAEQA